jgi:hypothetical protein
VSGVDLPRCTCRALVHAVFGLGDFEFMWLDDHFTPARLAGGRCAKFKKRSPGVIAAAFTPTVRVFRTVRRKPIGRHGESSISGESRVSKTA